MNHEYHIQSTTLLPRHLFLAQLLQRFFDIGNVDILAPGLLALAARLGRHVVVEEVQWARRRVNCVGGGSVR